MDPATTIFWGTLGLFGFALLIFLLIWVGR